MLNYPMLNYPMLNYPMLNYSLNFLGHLEKSKFSPLCQRKNRGCGGRRSRPTQLIEVPLGYRDGYQFKLGQRGTERPTVPLILSCFKRKPTETEGQGSRPKARAVLSGWAWT